MGAAHSRKVMHLDRVDVSVVVAAWNAETFLQGSIDSALAQDGVTIEVIVANDASTDGTEALVRSLAERDPRIRLVSNTVNQGPAAARNTAIAAATGAWIAVLDADDRLLPGRFARLLSFARARDADVVFDLIGEVDEEGREVPDPRPQPFHREECWDLPRWILDNQPGQRMLLTGYLKPLIRRTALTQHGVSYREELRNSEDYALIAELLAQGASVWLLPEPGYLYTRRAGSISHRVGPKHLVPLLAFEAEFATHLAEAGADPAILTLQEKRIAALKNTLALARVIEDLRARSPLRALQALATRPQATGLFMRWIGEVVLKRTGLRQRA